MTTPSRHQGRRSLSLFSLGHFRSRSRSEVHAGTHIPSVPCQRADLQTAQPHEVERSATSLSCNPNVRLQVSPEPNAVVSNVVAEGHLHDPPSADFPRGTALAQLRGQAHQSKTLEKTRPRTWFAFPRSSLRKRHILGRSFSLRLPKETSSSTVARSVISAPVLTGTTNIDVAEAEGVCCRDIVDAGLTSHTKQKPSKTSSNNVLRYVHAGKVRLFRAASTSKGQKEKAESFILAATPQHDPGPISEDSWRFSAVERGVSRRRAEAMNLCRQKINKLTGNGNIKRKSINHNSSLSAADGAGTNHHHNDGDIIDPQSSSQPHTEEGQFLTLKHDSVDIHSGSLSKSFASAIDKLEFRSSSSVDNMGFMKVKQSILNLRKRNKHADDTNVKPGGRGQENLNVMAQPDTTVSNEKSHPEHDTILTEALNTPNEQNEIGFPPKPSQFSAEANNYVPSAPVTPYPKGVKVLGMHSNTMDFATAPSWVTDLPKPVPNPPPAREAPAVDDDEQVIEDAPIYSPSMGNLSQYARATPPSAESVVNPQQRPEPETPTRVPAEKGHLRRLGLGRSKSGLGLLGLFSKGQKGDEKEVSGGLHAQDVNQRISKMQQLKKSRSMNLPGLLKKGDTSSGKGAFVKEPMDVTTQPMKPSPLRFEAKVDDNAITYPPPATADHLRSPPRGSITPSDRAKRMGVVGMPRESFDKVEEEN